MDRAVIRPACCDRASTATDVAQPTLSATTILSIPDMMCGVCINRIEEALLALDGVDTARASLTQRRVLVRFDETRTGLESVLAALGEAGFSASEIRDEDKALSSENEKALLPRVGVAGFAAANVMLLSVSVWSGLASDMDPVIAGMFHWISALIALPAIAYAGMPFFSSAAKAVRARHLNMDVPISIGVLLATGVSLVQTMRGTGHVYFDAAITLLFFLLIGRLLDQMVRRKARSSAENLAGLRPTLATVIDDAGKIRKISSFDLHPGARVLVAVGERLPSDGEIVSGTTDIDESVITGETSPRSAATADRVHAGTLNIGAPIEIAVTAAGADTLLAEVSRMMLDAEQSRGRYVRLADRAAKIYAPAVHVLGLLTFASWMLNGAGLEFAITTAIAVIIITCPCALALAVPAVQISATSRLYKRGVIVKAADGLERLAKVDHVVLDKTGTLSIGKPELADRDTVLDSILADAAALAVASRHPYAMAVVEAARARGLEIQRNETVQERPGQGLLAKTGAGPVRLGSASWIGVAADHQNAGSQLWFSKPSLPAYGFRFEDALRSDAAKTVSTIQQAGLSVELLSGDRRAAVSDAARETGIDTWRAEVTPQDKIVRIETLAREGRKVLMVGDGLNDAPALAAAHASISPANAIDITQAASDFVFQGKDLGSVVEALVVARAAERLSRQNLALALFYNAIFVPLAMLGFVTPLVAAIAMSASSISVTLNALRLHRMTLCLPKSPTISADRTEANLKLLEAAA